MLVALTAGYILALYFLVLLHWYRPKDKGKFARTKLGALTPWLAAHPFVPLPAAAAVLFAAAGFSTSLEVARVLLWATAGVCAAAAAAVALHEPAWAREGRLYFEAEASYTPGRAERIEWVASALFVTGMVVSFVIVLGPTPTTLAEVAIVIGAALGNIRRRFRQKH